MRFAAAAALVSLVGAATAETWRVEVGAGGLVFTPRTVTAALGDTVLFQWVALGGNHSVTQSSFADPCSPNSGGFESGWIFVPENLNLAVDPAPNWNITINSTDPIWYFCRQANATVDHCEDGMIGAINPTADQSFESFLQAASSLSPSTDPVSNAPATAGINAFATAAPSPTFSPIDPGNTTAFSHGASGSSGSSGSSSGSSPSSTSSSSSGAGPIAQSSVALMVVATLLGVTFA